MTEAHTGGGLPEIANLITFVAHISPESGWAHLLHKFENSIFSFIIILAMGCIALFATRQRRLVPVSTLENIVETAVEGLDNFVCGVLGKEGSRYTPFIGTLFLYILFMNLSAILPGMKSPTSSLNTTLALAICVFFYVQYTGLKRLGIGGYLYHMMGSPKIPEGTKGMALILILPILIAVHIILFFIHLVEELIKPLSLSLRLFGNITGEDALLALFVTLGIMSLSFLKSPVGLPLQLPAAFLAILLGTIQALVFSLLSTIYISMMLPHSEK